MTELTTAVEGVNKGELFTSFDVDAFEVPHGRDEIWRFTPLRRLRGLHDGATIVTVDKHTAPGDPIEITVTGPGEGATA